MAIRGSDFVLSPEKMDREYMLILRKHNQTGDKYSHNLVNLEKANRAWQTGKILHSFSSLPPNLAEKAHKIIYSER